MDRKTLPEKIQPEFNPNLKEDFEASFEQIENQETKENLPEKKGEQPQEAPGKKQKHLDNQATVGAPGIDVHNSATHQQIESILEDGLEDIYKSMSAQEQEVFKQKGEETASKINKLLKEAKATFKKVFKLIASWLKVIPGVNKMYIEQESKIKADKILDIDI